jgi:hypothetical protein
MLNYLITQTKHSLGVVTALGGVTADGDQYALNDLAKLVRSKIGTPDFDLDDLITITRPDGSVLAKATVAEFERS